jgi:hypothetical protein
MGRRLLTANASTNAQQFPTINVEKMAPIKVALCMQRYASLSPEMSQLEKDYSKLIEKLEIEHSYLSDHELRRKQERFVDEYIDVNKTRHDLFFTLYLFVF